MILMVAAGVFLVLFARTAEEQPPGIETHWGGFGGGLGGIRISPSLLYLVVALVLAALALTIMPRGVPLPSAIPTPATQTPAPLPLPTPSAATSPAATSATKATP
jgi:hypothetical protein